MTTLVFRLRNVPDDEAQAVRALLDANNIQWYETTAGNWGIAMPGLWIKDPQQAEKARLLIDQYQSERQKYSRSAYEEELRTGNSRTFADSVREKPLTTFAILAFCLFILYISINPFLQLIGLTS
ncbi:MAG: hypothetical protein KTR32_08415 [Granulosicoccus sp.]|nr:hypothetical protein [Granulosicoccus sp.]